MSTLAPPPTYAEPVVVDEKTGKSTFNPLWLKWFLDVTQFVSANGGSSGSSISHEALQGLQGGGTGEHYHLSAANSTALTAGFSGTGVLVRQTGASFTDTPSFGDNTAMAKSSSALTNAAGASVGTLTNAPAAGNPTKWVQINDAGTVRRIPTW